ncbi:MAG: glycosyltransferase family 39 protein [Chloroflexota bacterium]
MPQNKWSRLLIIFCLLALIIPSHVIGIDKFITYDEPWWIISGSNYYYALTHKDFASTMYDYHPAVTTTWMVTAGMLSYFPEYRGFGQGYFDVRKPHFEAFMRDHGKEVIGLVRNSRLIQIALIIVLAILSFYLLQLLIDWRAAFLAIVLAMNAPFFLGISRLLNHEGMLSMFMLVSLLGMQVYLNKDRRLIYLLISGAAFGLAQLTKSSSVVLFPLVGLMSLISILGRAEESFAARIWFAIKSLTIWLLMAAFVFVALWPGMWVAPGKMLSEIYGNAFSYAFQGARLEVTDGLEPSTFALSDATLGVQQFSITWLLFSTVITWIGLAFAALLLVSRDKTLLPPPVKSSASYLVLLAALVITMFGVAQGRNASYYIMTSFVTLDVAAGIGWGCFFLWLQNRSPVFQRFSLQATFILLVAAVQIGIGLPYYPYYITYRNPVISPPAAFAYGVGLDQAAAYLAEKPDAENTVVYAYVGMGTFSYFYPGETLVFKRVHLVNGDFETVIAEMHTTDYLVVYSAAQNAQTESQEFLAALENVQPEKVILINGVEYARIYKISDIPESAYLKMTR